MSGRRRGSLADEPTELLPERGLARQLKRLSQLLFPGDRRLWAVAGVVLAATLVLIAIALLQPRGDLLGSNSIGARTATAIVPANTPLCVSHLRVPAGTGQVQFALDTRTEPRPELEVAIREASGSVIRGSSPPSSAGGYHPYTIAIPTLPARPAFVLADVCLTAKARVFAWGTGAPQSNIPAPTVGGIPITTGHVSVWFLGPPGVRRSIASQMGEMFHRAALFGAGFVGAWTYWVLFFLVFPVLAYGAVRLLATADIERRRRVPLPLLVGLIAFGVAAAWALITPAFQSPDESEHFAYVQYFAETGRAVEAVQTARSPYSDAEVIALEAVYHTSVIERAETRPPWLSADVQAYKE
ncbi:MAG TPA: hypothetical protein VES65_03225, partial [Solirubrobacteraceae bacterium]|nr:hypothetical protein [Solirubrobacteraceae bacterium]